MESYRPQIVAWMDEGIENLPSDTVLCEDFERMGMEARAVSVTRNILESAQKRTEGILDYFNERMHVAEKGETE